MAKSRSALQVGNEVFVRTVTYHYTGRIVEVGPDYFVMEDAAWIPESGRWNEALKTGVLSEVEPYVHDITINRLSFVDATIWGFALPRKAK